MHLDLSDIAAMFALLVGAVVVAGLAERTRCLAPIVLVLVGLAVSQVPGVPEYELNPELVLFCFLPPLLYAAAWTSSVRRLPGEPAVDRAAVGRAGARHHGWPSASSPGRWSRACRSPPAFALGAIVAPPDAVAATAVGRGARPAAPDHDHPAGREPAQRRDRADRAAGGDRSRRRRGHAARRRRDVRRRRRWAGAAIGFAIGWVLHRVRRQLEPVLENALALFAPFVAYLAAEVVHASGSSRSSSPGCTSAAPRRRRGQPPGCRAGRLGADRLRPRGPRLPAHRAAAAGRAGRRCAATRTARPTPSLVAASSSPWWWSSASRGCSRARTCRGCCRGGSGSASPHLPWTNPVVVSWAGMRGVVSLAAAFALARRLPASATCILFITFVVVFGTLSCRA